MLKSVRLTRRPQIITHLEMSLNMLRVFITVLILCTFGVEILDGVRNATDMAFYRNLIGKKIPLTMSLFGLVLSFLRLIKIDRKSVV